MKQISVTNYRGIKSLDIDASQLNVITAPNGSGKSSVVDAIRWFITGDIKDEDIRHKTDEAMITVEFESGSTMTRTRKTKEGSCYANGKKVDCKVFNEMLTNELGCNLVTAKAVCGTDFLDSLNTKDLTGFLLNILPITVKKESMNGLVEETLGKALLPDQKAYLDSLLTLNQYTLDDIQEVYNQVFATRRIRKKDLTDIKAKANFDTDTLPKETKADLDSQMEEIIKKEALVKDYNDRLKNYNDTVENYNKATTRKTQLENELKEYTDVTQPNKAEYEQAEIDKKKFVDAISQCSATVTFNKTRLNELIEAYNMSQNGQITCPLTKQICTSDLSEFQQAIATEGKNSNSRVQEAEALIEKCQKEIVRLDEVIKNYHDNNLKWTKKDALLKELKNLVIPTVPNKPEEIKSEDLTQIKNEINLKKSIYTAYEQAQAYSKQVIDLSREVEILELMVKLFDIKGVRSTLLKKALGAIETKVNTVAAVFRPDFKITLLGADGLDVNIYPDGKTPVPMDKVSSGEFILTAYILMGAIHDITNVPFLVIDDMDRLDKTNALAFMNLIEKDQRFKNVILAGVNHSDFTEAIPKSANVITL